MRFLVPYFGNDPRFAALLIRFVQAWRKKTDGHELFILTDRSTGIPPFETNDVEALRLTPSDAIAVRNGKGGEAFDYKAKVVLAYLSQERSTPCAILDIDNHLHRNPVPLLTEIGRAGLVAVMPDPGARDIKHPAFNQPVHEQSSSCMVFPADAREVAQIYVGLWNTSTEPTHFLLEQRTWTLVATAIGMTGPRSLSWSRLWGTPHHDTILEHRHGEEKWKNPPNP